MANLMVNELLCFLSHQFDKLDRSNLNAVLLEFYTREEVVTAKRILIAECEKDNVSNAINDSKKNRIGSNVEQKVIQDLIDIWQATVNSCSIEIRFAGIGSSRKKIK